MPTVNQLLQTDDPYITRNSFDGGGNQIYQGKAVPGSATSAAVWAIRRFTWSGGNLTAIDWANGRTVAENVWDNAASLSYS